MAVAAINLTFDDDFAKQIDRIAYDESLTLTDLIYNSMSLPAASAQVCGVVLNPTANKADDILTIEITGNYGDG
ncbi:MAG: hypothetical protein LBK66_02995 [Spirochaetaceae bacterium]|jgi:hypothetical protein|nr:hypothetical protein [Spirochaetaceae bacterium]